MLPLAKRGVLVSSSTVTVISLDVETAGDGFPLMVNDEAGWDRLRRESDSTGRARSMTRWEMEVDRRVFRRLSFEG